MRWNFTVPLLAALLLVGGCGKGNFSESANKGKENVFRYSIVVKPTSLDPAKVQDGDTIDLIQQVFEGLTAWSEENKPVPNLAESWDISPDGTTYTFHLKKNVKFHSGREVKAEDFKYSIERACDPKLQSATALTYLDDIIGVKDMVAGKASEVSGVKVVDDYTLEIKIDKPRAYFLGKLTYPVCFAVDKDLAKKGEEITTVDAMKSGTGPYIPESYQNEQLFVLAANKSYHGGAPAIDKIERPVIVDAPTRIAKFKSGDIDLTQLERQDIEAVKNDPKLKDELKYYARPAIWYVAFNLKMVPAFASKDVRKAIAMAINKERIVNDLLGGVNQVANGILPPGVDGARPDLKGIPYDPSAAKKLLETAGQYGKIPAIDMYFRAERPDIRIVVEAVQADLKQKLGITVNAKPLQWSAYLDRHNKKELPFFHMRWGADYLDPQNFLSLMLATDGAENKTYYSNPSFDALCAAADIEQDHDKRMQMYAKAEDIALDDVAWIPIYYQRDAELVSPRIKGMRESLFGHLPHTKVSLSQ